MQKQKFQIKNIAIAKKKLIKKQNKTYKKI